MAKENIGHRSLWMSPEDLKIFNENLVKAIRNWGSEQTQEYNDYWKIKAKELGDKYRKEDNEN